MWNAREDKKNCFRKNASEFPASIAFPFMLVESCAMATFQRFLFHPTIHLLLSRFDKYFTSLYYGYDCLQNIDFLMKNAKKHKAKLELQASAFFTFLYSPHGEFNDGVRQN